MHSFLKCPTYNCLDLPEVSPVASCKCLCVVETGTLTPTSTTAECQSTAAATATATTYYIKSAISVLKS